MADTNAVSPDNLDLSFLPDVNPEAAHENAVQQKYGGVGQTIGAGLEGLSRGAIGATPTALIEKGLSGAGIPGLSPEEQAGRSEASPLASGLGEVAGFGGSLLTGEGIAKGIGAVGEAATGLNKVGEGASALEKIAESGIRTGAEMAALQADSELAKAINQDPNQSLGSAVINIGLSGVLGGVGGAAVGSIGPLWDTAANKLQTQKLASDMMGELQFRQGVDAMHGDLVTGATKEVADRMAQTQEMMNKAGVLKKEAIEKLLPEATPANLAKVDEHVQEIYNKGVARLEEAADNKYLKKAVPLLGQDLEDFAKVITNPQSSIADKFGALENYKRASQGHANYRLSADAADEAVSKWMKGFNKDLRLAGEDTKVWGEAGKTQKTINQSLHDLFNAQKDFTRATGGKEMNEIIANPDKIRTMLEQAKKGKGALKANAVNNYLEATNKAADAINEAHLHVSADAPAISQFNPTPILDHVLNTPQSAGRTLGSWLHESGASALANSAGATAGATIGGGIGSLIGHPAFGAYVGKNALAPIMSALAKPFAEKAINSTALKSTVEYAANIMKGDRILNDSVKNLFKTGEVLPRSMMPTDKSRDKVQKSLDHVEKSPDNMMQVGGKLGHYLPDHGSAASQMATIAQRYLDGLKPKPSIMGPLDNPIPPDKAAMAKYIRQLDIAQQPLLILQHVKDGTLQAQDVATLNTIYPGLHSKIVNKVTDEMIQAKAEGQHINYSQRMSLGLLMGTPLDATQNAASMQAIIHSVQMQPTAPQQHKQSGGIPAKSLKTMEKVNDMYQTKLQARETHRGK